LYLGQQARADVFGAMHRHRNWARHAIFFHDVVAAIDAMLATKLIQDALAGTSTPTQWLFTQLSTFSPG